MRDKRVVQLQRSVDETTSEASRLRSDMGMMEKQCSSLSRSLSSSERQVKQLEADKTRFSRDINAARDLSVTIDRSKEELHRQVANLAIECEQNKRNLLLVESEKDDLEGHVRSEVCVHNIQCAIETVANVQEISETKTRSLSNCLPSSEPSTFTLTRRTSKWTRRRT